MSGKASNISGGSSCTATVTAATTTNIPIIYLDDGANRAETVAAIRKACTECGFFYVTRHCVDPPCCQAVMEQSERFFDLPLVEKKAVSDAQLTRGYTAMQEETLDPANQTEGDTKEGFYISINDIPVDDPRYNPSKLAGPNQWPTPETCPSLADPTLWKQTMQEYMRQVTQLSRQIVRLLAESLDLPTEYFDDYFRDGEALGALRLLHYAATPSQIELGRYACGAHSDYGMITVLLTDVEPGLEIFDQRGCQQWIPVPPLPNHFVVNLGDMLERWTNGRYCSTLHRVINYTGRERYSIPFFLEPSFDTIVKCLPTCCSDDDNPAQWPPITSGEHLLSKYAQTHADFVAAAKTDN